MSQWGWQPEHSQGIWRHGAAWLRPFAVVAPFLTVALLFLMFHLADGSLARDEGILFELPEAGSVTDSDRSGPVALVMNAASDTLVFFDDARYVIGDEVSMRSFGEHLRDALNRSESKTLLLLADRRIAGGTLMKLADTARRCGAKRALFAERKAEETE